MNEELIERIKQFNIDVKREVDIVEERVCSFLSRWKGPMPQVLWSVYLAHNEVDFELEWYESRDKWLCLTFYSRHDPFYLAGPYNEETRSFVTKKCPTDEEIMEYVKDMNLNDGHMARFWR